MDGSALTDESAVVVIDVLANDSNDGMRASAIVTVTVGAKPYGVAFDGSNIWVANYSDNTVSKIVP